MTTTAIVVELLVVGMQAVAWLIPMMSLSNPAMAASLLEMPKFDQPSMVAVYLAGVYTLGVLADTAARGVVLPIQCGKWLLRYRWVSERADRSQEDARIRIAAKEAKLDNLVTHYVVRMRVLRGIAFNSILAAVLWLLTATFDRTPFAGGNARQVAVTLGLTALVVGIVSGVTFALDQAGYERRI